MVENDNIRTGEAYALTRATNRESELYNFGSREQLKKHAYLSTLLLTELLIAQLLLAPLPRPQEGPLSRGQKGLRIDNAQCIAIKQW